MLRPNENVHFNTLRGGSLTLVAQPCGMIEACVICRCSCNKYSATKGDILPRQTVKAGTQRLSLCRVDPVDFVKESKQLEEYIQKLSLNQPIMQPLPAAGAGGYGGGRTPGAQGGEQISVPVTSTFSLRSLCHAFPITQEDFHTWEQTCTCVCAARMWIVTLS